MDGKNNLTQLLQERFSGHELPAPDGAWEAISSQLTLSAAASADGVNDLFRDRFAQHEAHVDPSVWSSIEGQLGNGVAGGAGAGAGWTTVAGWAAAGVAVLLMTAGVVLWNEDKKELPEQKAVAVVPVPQQQVEQNTTTIEPVATPAENKIGDAPAVAASSTQRPAPSAQPAVKHSQSVDAVVTANDPPAVPAVIAPTPQDNTAVTTSASTLPDQVITEMINEADHEVLQPATVPDTALDNDGPVMAPPVFGAEPEAEEFHIFMPNVFTPYNHDGINDVYLPQGEGFSSVIIRVQSLADNRLVFSSNELTPWDGKDMTTGEDCAEGHYLYALEVIGTDGKVRTQGQVVLLMR